MLRQRKRALRAQGQRVQQPPSVWGTQVVLFGQSTGRMVGGEEAEHGALRRGRRRATLMWSALCPSDRGEHWPFLSREVTPFIRVSANPSESNTKNWQK